MNAVRNQPTFLEKIKIKQNGLKSELTQMQHNVELYLLQRPEEKKGDPYLIAEVIRFYNFILLH